MPTSLPSESTSRAPTDLSAMVSMAVYTDCSGLTNQISFPLRLRTEPTVPLILISITTSTSDLMLRYSSLSQVVHRTLVKAATAAREAGRRSGGQICPMPPDLLRKRSLVELPLEARSLH